MTHDERTGYRSGDPYFDGGVPIGRGSSRGGTARGGAAGDDGNTPEFLCDFCGAPMLDRHCKLACPNCGYLRDCSDP